MDPGSRPSHPIDDAFGQAISRTLSPCLVGLVSVVVDTKLATLAATAESLALPLVAWGVPLPNHLADAAPVRQASYVAGRLAARDALRKGGIGHKFPESCPHSHLPLWPEGVKGSLSHSQVALDSTPNLIALVAVAVVHQAPKEVDTRNSTLLSLGVDVERIMDPQRAEKLVPRIAPHGLMPWTASASVAVRTTIEFSAKEAVFKAAHLWNGSAPGLSAIVFHDGQVAGQRDEALNGGVVMRGQMRATFGDGSCNSCAEVLYWVRPPFVWTAALLRS